MNESTILCNHYARIILASGGAISENPDATHTIAMQSAPRAAHSPHQQPTMRCSTSIEGCRSCIRDRNEGAPRSYTAFCLPMACNTAHTAHLSRPQRYMSTPSQASTHAKTPAPVLFQWRVASSIQPSSSSTVHRVANAPLQGRQCYRHEVLRCATHPMATDRPSQAVRH